MSAAEETAHVPEEEEAEESELRSFLQPVGNFRHANHGTMFQVMAAFIVGPCDSLGEPLEEILTRGVATIEDEQRNRVFDLDKFASKEAWHNAHQQQLRGLQDIYFVRELLRRAFAEGALKEELG